MIRVACLTIGLACTVALAAPAQATGRQASDPAVTATATGLRAALTELVRADRELMPADAESTLRPVDDDALERRAVARARIIAGLDTLLGAGVAGRTAIRRLAAEWPGVDLVRRAEIRAAFRANDAADALAVTTKFALTAPRDTQLLRWRAEALESLNRPADALRARQARFELAPEEPAGWRALLAAHEAAGSLPRLRESLSRLRLLYPDSRIVREQEIEVLHRLGRRDEAARLAADTTGMTP